MIRFLFLCTLFVLFLFEGTVFQVFAPERWGLEITMVPRFVVVLIIISLLFLGHIQGLLIGLIFGLLNDLIYGNVIGIYAFSMALVGYFSGLTFRIFQQNLFLILMTVLCILALHEWMVYGMMTLINMSTQGYESFIIYRLVPTLVLNMVFALLVAYPVRTLIERLKQEEEK